MKLRIIPTSKEVFRALTGSSVTGFVGAGAGFVVAILGEMMTMPGLPKIPAAMNMDMDDDGNLTGVFG